MSLGDLTVALIGGHHRKGDLRGPAGTAAEVEIGVTAAAQRTWTKLPAIERARYLYDIAQGIRERSEILPLARVEVSAYYMDWPLIDGFQEGP